MRTRATVVTVAVAGAVALSAVVVPAAQAAGGGSRHPVGALEALHTALAGKSAFTGASPAGGVPYPLDVTFGSVKVNKGRPIAAGTGGRVSVPVTFTITHGAGVDLGAEDVQLDLVLYRGASFAHPVKTLIGDYAPGCTAAGATVASCAGTIDIAPSEQLDNVDASVWKAAGYVIDWNDVDPRADDVDWSRVGYTEGDALASVQLQRSPRMTVDAAPEPVKKGKKITVTGKLARANWDTGLYGGVAAQPVKLEFRKKGSSAYSTVKTVKSSAGGGLKTTVTASVDGYYRFTFAGNATVPAVGSAGDFVDVR
ncbi:hypothetical protein OG802_15905 [Streptomyces sp. NBC_00704]|uniref:hypothetical protein n=1 Tax=Streptomyces sp. NBC_00704 TaxID=2975809 RepID=UPI002E3281C5|nr:hypothetical protein [Streptomyces sp. NBC_00704]